MSETFSSSTLFSFRWIGNRIVRKCFTAVLERNSTFTDDFETEPYEVGWASEARWFIHVLDVSGHDFGLGVYAQISPDGLSWCDEGMAALVIRGPGLYSFSLHSFGQWLRLHGVFTGDQPHVKVLIYLALKE